MHKGYVKVWRKIEDSGLMQIPNTLALFMHILFNATHKDRKLGTPVGVIELKRGQFLSGRIELARTLKQSEQQVRTSLKKLELMKILTIQSTNRYSIYTIENYSKYQDEQPTDNQQNNQQITNSQPADNQQITTKQELKNLSIEECNKKPSAIPSELPDWLPNDLWQEFKQMRKGLKKPMTPKAEVLLIKDLEKIKDQGHDPIEALNNSIKNSWQGIFAPNGKTLMPKRRSAMDISGIDYSAGITEDGRF
ncbi:MAG TPA: hypothetical protein VL943_01735 [Niabella sp.]|nr:hypothetical protein [Niabella sp.]